MAMKPSSKFGKMNADDRSPEQKVRDYNKANSSKYSAPVSMTLGGKKGLSYRAANGNEVRWTEADTKALKNRSRVNALKKLAK